MRSGPAVIAALVLAACGDNNKSAADAGDIASADDSATDTVYVPGDTAPPEADSAIPQPDSAEPGTTSALTGVSAPASPAPEPTPNAECANSGHFANSDGFTYPWQGVEYEGDALTCNGCKSGLRDLQGSWRVHGSDDQGSDYSIPDPVEDYAERLDLDGNTFQVHIRDARAETETTYRGYYFCSQAPEIPSADLLWVVTESDGVYFEPGDVIITTLPVADWVNEVRISYLDEPGSEHMLTYAYCLIGTSNPYNARSDQRCTDPFAE